MILLIGLSLNILLLAMVIPSVIRGSSRMTDAYGGDTPARRILLCLYSAILAASILLAAALFAGAGWAPVATLTLFGIQIGYKLATVAALGSRHPVAAANLMIAVALGAVGAGYIVAHG